MIRKLLGLAVFVALANVCFAQVDNPDPELRTVTIGDMQAVAGEVLVQFNEEVDSHIWAGIHEYVGGGVFENITESLHRVKLPDGMQIEEAIAQYESFSHEVEFAEPNLIYELLDTPNDPAWNQQWGPKKIDANDAWDIFTGDPNYVVAVIDTGVDMDHVDLADDYAWGHDYYSGDTNPNDQYGHGTHCCGISAAETNNGVGIAGVSRDCRFAAYRTGNNGLSVSAIVNSINNAVSRGAHAISMSFGGTGQSSSMNNALNSAWNAGVVNVAAAGNNGNTTKFYPAGYANVIAVASSTPTDNRSSFSTYGNWVDVAAPGSNIYSTWNNGNYATASGTSMACPHVAGEAVLLYSYLGSARSNSNASLIRNAIQNSAVDVGNWVIHGRVDVDDAILALNPPGPPVINNITPSNTSSCGGETITINGTDLAGATDVSVGGNSVGFNVVSNNQVTFSAPFHPGNLNSENVVLTTPQGSDNASLGYFAQDEPDIRGTTFIIRPGGGNWTECGGVQANGNGRLFVEFIGTNGGTTPIGNGLSVPVGNGQLWAIIPLDPAGTHQTTLPGYNGGFSGSIYFGIATYDLVQGQWTDVRPGPFRVTVF